MNHIREMVQFHPGGTAADQETLIRCIEHCYDCGQTCMACADACLGEPDPKSMDRCIRLNQDCAEICFTTGNIVSRLTQADWELIRSQLQACAAACRICGDECQQHADKMNHCRICAEACRACEQACSEMINAIPTAAPVGG